MKKLHLCSTTGLRSYTVSVSSHVGMKLFLCLWVPENGIYSSLLHFYLWDYYYDYHNLLCFDTECGLDILRVPNYFIAASSLLFSRVTKLK